PLLQSRDGLQVDGGVLADGGVRAAAGLDADDALGGERLVAHEEARVFLGVDVVGDGGDVVPVAQGLAQGERERGLPRAYGTADADAKGAVQAGLHAKI